MDEAYIQEILKAAPHDQMTDESFDLHTYRDRAAGYEAEAAEAKRRYFETEK